MKKILYVANVDWYFCLHWLDRAVYFIELGNEVHLTCKVTDSKYVDLIRDNGIILHESNLSRSGANPFLLYREFSELSRLTNILKPTLINSLTVKPNVMAGLKSITSQVPIVCSVTGLGSSFSSNKMKSVVSKLFIALSYRVIGFFNKKSIFVFENMDDMVTIKNLCSIKENQLIKVAGAGVDPEEFDYHEINLSSIEDGVKVLFASRLLKSKGLSYLCKAMKGLEDVNVSLDIAGIYDFESDDSISAEELDLMIGCPNINFLGQVDNISKILANYQLVCLPTYYGEGIPRILIEAAASGRPIITTSKGGCAEICINNFNGTVVAPRSSKSIQEAITKYVSNPRLIVLHGRNGRVHFEKSFSNESVFKAFLGIYEGII